MGTKGFVLHEKVINVFHNKFYIPAIYFCSFNLCNVRILASSECGKLEMILSMKIDRKNSNLKKRHKEKFSEKLVYKYKIRIGMETGSYQWKEFLLNIF